MQRWSEEGADRGRKGGKKGRRPGADRWRGEWRQGRKERQIDEDRFRDGADSLIFKI